jgi:hypothetical protein
VISNDKFSYYSPALSIYFLSGKNDKQVFDGSFIGLQKRSGVKISLHPTAAVIIAALEMWKALITGELLKNEINSTQFKSTSGMKTVHVSQYGDKNNACAFT